MPENLTESERAFRARVHQLHHEGRCLAYLKWIPNPARGRPCYAFWNGSTDRVRHFVDPDAAYRALKGLQRKHGGTIQAVEPRR